MQNGNLLPRLRKGVKLGETGRAALAVFGVVSGAAIGWIAVSNQFKRPPAPRVFRGQVKKARDDTHNRRKSAAANNAPGIAIEN